MILIGGGLPPGRDLDKVSPLGVIKERPPGADHLGMIPTDALAAVAATLPPTLPTATRAAILAAVERYGDTRADDVWQYTLAITSQR